MMRKLASESLAAITALPSFPSTSAASSLMIGASEALLSTRPSLITLAGTFASAAFIRPPTLPASIRTVFPERSMARRLIMT